MKANKIILNGIRIGIILFLFNLTIKYAHSAYLGWLRTFIGKNKKVKSVY